MSKMIQIRGVPDEIHRTLKVRAAQAGMTLSAYLLREVTKVAERPTLDEVLERIRQHSKEHGPVEGDLDSVQIIRELRGPMP